MSTETPETSAPLVGMNMVDVIASDPIGAPLVVPEPTPPLTEVFMMDGKKYKVVHQFSDQRIVVEMAKGPVLATFAGRHPDGFVFEPARDPATPEELALFPKVTSR